jgi:peptidoglycan/LPS O-acetylase OafA/YrhL
MLKQQGLLPYVAGRLLRIYPGIIVAILLCALIIGPITSTFSEHEYFHSHELHTFMIKNMTLWRGIQDQLPGVFSSNPLHDVINTIWTLPNELKMYATIFVFGLARLAFRDQTRAIKVMKAVVSTIVIIYLINKLMHPQQAEAARLEHLACYFFLGSWTFLYRDKLRLSPLIAVALWIATLALHQYSAFVPLFRIALVYTVFLLAFHPDIQLNNFGKNGDFSYGMYIYAYPIQQLLIRYHPAITPMELFGTALVLTLPMAFLSWHLIEKPALNLKRRLMLKKGDQASASASQPSLTSL